MRSTNRTPTGGLCDRLRGLFFKDLGNAINTGDPPGPFFFFFFSSLIKTGSLHVVGVARLPHFVVCRRYRLNYADYEPFHRVAPADQVGAIERKWLHPWVLEDVRRLSRPVRPRRCPRPSYLRSVLIGSMIRRMWRVVCLRNRKEKEQKVRCPQHALSARNSSKSRSRSRRSISLLRGRSRSGTVIPPHCICGGHGGRWRRAGQCCSRNWWTIPRLGPTVSGLEEAQDAERKRLHKIIADMVPWEASNKETILNAARWEIARSVAWALGEEPPPKNDSKAIVDYLQTKAPPVYDPFSGGGSIPLEAQRLGFRAYGSDLNPVAVLIGKALVEIPPKFAGQPPVNPKAREEHAAAAGGKGRRGWPKTCATTASGCAMRRRNASVISIRKQSCQMDRKRPLSLGCGHAPCARPIPRAKGAMVPLVSSFMLSTKEGRMRGLNR